MESNLCDGNHSDSNVLLPPRKRLLAGFKKLNSDQDLGNSLSPDEKEVSDSRIDALMKYHLENPNLSLEEIVERSNKAAEEAVNMAVVARARAVEKEIVAAKAMARAKVALELVADITDEVYGQRDKYLKKNKFKKQLPVKMLYDKNGNVGNCTNKDEELALRLHHAINSSPRITRNAVSSDLKTNKQKRMKGLSVVEGSRVYSNGDGEEESEETDSEELMGEGRDVSVFENTLKWKQNSLVVGNGEADSSNSKGKSSESSDDLSSVGRKRGRMKQKKLPLSICSIRDVENNNEGMRSNGEEKIGKNNVGAASMWKCKAFKAPDCVKRNKVMEP